MLPSGYSIYKYIKSNMHCYTGNAPLWTCNSKGWHCLPTVFNKRNKSRCNKLCRWVADHWTTYIIIVSKKILESFIWSSTYIRDSLTVLCVGCYMEYETKFFEYYYWLELHGDLWIFVVSKKFFESVIWSLCK